MITIEITELELELEIELAAAALLDTAPRPAARCADGNGTLTHLFFSDDLVDIARAKAICARCPLREPCLEGALARVEPWGVWGGELVDTGRIVATKRPRGRPPKHPRPVIVVDEDRHVREVASIDEIDVDTEVAVRVA
ncbi:MAG: WhiB family transcriptional regulator [Ilumatobacteraceae bacterium]|nr:MAG: WhiB family transcriptional regulator [Actinomycetota bacterium]